MTLDCGPFASGSGNQVYNQLQKKFRFLKFKSNGKQARMEGNFLHLRSLSKQKMLMHTIKMCICYDQIELTKLLYGVVLQEIK